jgi:hypothetical protein
VVAMRLLVGSAELDSAELARAGERISKGFPRDFPGTESVICRISRYETN